MTGKGWNCSACGAHTPARYRVCLLCDTPIPPADAARLGPPRVGWWVPIANAWWFGRVAKALLLFAVIGAGWMTGSGGYGSVRHDPSPKFFLGVGVPLLLAYLAFVAIRKPGRRK